MKAQSGGSDVDAKNENKPTVVTVMGLLAQMYSKTQTERIYQSITAMAGSCGGSWAESTPGPSASSLLVTLASWQRMDISCSRTWAQGPDGASTDELPPASKKENRFAENKWR